MSLFLFLTYTVSTSTTTKCYETARRKLSKQNELFIIGVVLGNSSMFMHEVCQEVRDVLGIVISPPTICRLLHSHGITRKKIRQITLQRSYSLRGAFRAQCSLFHPDMFVFVDETGVDHRDHIRRYGYALRGVTPEFTRPFCGHGHRINAIVGISTDGVTAVELTTSAVNTDIFLTLHGDLSHQTCSNSMVQIHGLLWSWTISLFITPTL